MPSATSNAAAVELTVESMRAAGSLKDSDEALIEALRGLAAAVDADPTNASLWREYRGALADIRGLTDGDSDAFDDLLGWLRAPVRHTPN